MNRLNIEKQEAIVSALTEGNSIRSTERMTGVHRDTILRLVVRLASGCERLMDSSMRGLKCERVQVDELWAYVGKKQRHLTITDDPNRVGDVWTFVALDADTKLVPCYRVGKRTAPEARAFLADLSGRLINRVQLSSDSLIAYVQATEEAFGKNVDYGQIVKSYEAEPIGPGRYSPPHVIAAERIVISGTPELRHISTSYIERQNLTVRMSMRRFTRLTNGFSKKIENLKAAVALHFAHYNFCRVHKTLRVTPAMEAGVASDVWTLRDLISEVDALAIP